MNSRRIFSTGRLIAVILMGAVVLTLAARAEDAPAKQWISIAGKEGPGKGKQIVLIAAANEYNPETGLPMLAKILSERHGFNCTVLFSTNKAGEVDPVTTDNIPGLEALDHADLMIILARFRALPDDQMKHVVDFVEAGKPVIGLRTATHAFKYPSNSKSIYKKYSSDNKSEDFNGGFGRQVLGETWITHHAPNGKTSTRAIFADGVAGDPILRGIGEKEIWGTTGAYGVRLPLLEGCKTLLLGQVIDGNQPSGQPQAGKPNDPMMPVAWSRTYSVTPGKTGRVLTTTMGSASDLQSEGLRRLLVNGCYWTLKMEGQIPAKANVDLVGETITYKKGMKASDYQN